MYKKCCVVIPVYNDIPTENENLSIITTIAKLSRFDLFIVAPNDLDIKYYQEHYNCNVLRMDARVWRSKDRNKFPNYNRMMMSVGFYRKFDDYQYMLICQPDCLILKDGIELESLCDMEYDYVGGVFCYNAGLQAAPRIWLYKKYPSLNTREFFCGNGGLSLRKVKAVKKYIKMFKAFSAGEEDIFFMYFNRKWFRTADKIDAAKLSLNNTAIQYLCEGVYSPLGIHKWEENFPDIIKGFQCDGK